MSLEETFMRVMAKNHVYKTHHGWDSKSNNSTYVPKMIKDQKSVLRRYKMYEYPFECSKSSILNGILYAKSL